MPWRSAIAALVVLGVLALPIFQLELGQNDISALPKETTSRQAYDGLNAGFGPGVNGPLLIASEFSSPEEAQQVLPGLQKAIGGADDVAAVTEPSLSEDKKVAVFTVISKSEPWADETVSLVENLRDEVIPGALEGTKAQSYVGGQTAGYIDLAAKIADKLPLMIAVVVALSFLVLLMAFRSLLVPIKAAAMNLISVAASYGVVTAVFQLGWGSSLIGLDHAIPIVSFVPLTDVRDPLRALDGLRGLPDDADEGTLRRVRRRAPRGGRRAGQHRPRDHLGGGDHGLRLRQLRPQRRPGGEGVRGRAGGGDRDRLDRRPLPAGAGGDGADGQVGLVDAGLAGADRAAHQHRGRGVLRGARRGRRRGCRTRCAAPRLRQTEGRCSRSTCRMR